MARAHEAAELLKSGSPPWAIAQKWSVSHETVVQYLYRAVGLGLISRSEIFYSIDKSMADLVEQWIADHSLRNRIDLELPLKQQQVTGMLWDSLLYFDLREAPLADMYESLCRLERFLHGYIRDELRRGFGPKDWWRKGIPLGVRKDCKTRHEEDPEADEQDDPYSYTTFIQLKEIFDRRWGLFSKLLPSNTAADKQKFLSDLTRANTIRNKVMHPVRGYRPPRDEYDFIKAFAARVFAEPV